MRSKLPRRLALVLALVSAAALGLGACSRRSDSTTGPSVVVTMTDSLRFVPDRVTVRVGQSVLWRNGSLLVHSVTCDTTRAASQEDVALPAGAGPFDSGLMSPDSTFEHVFTVAGTYRYFCVPHEATGMVGTVVVKP